MKKRAIVLGSAGSIGRSSLDVLAALADEWDVVGLSTGSRWEVIAEQARRHHPHAVAITSAEAGHRLRSSLNGCISVISGEHAAVQLLNDVECDCVVAGITGAASLPATIRAVELGRRVALANKEALVVAGSILMPLVQRCGADVVPVDSEHSAIFQAMQAGCREEVRRIILTASGGPFRDWSRQRMAGVTLQDALSHPTWNMGPKITIDCATMMNKALEIVEAHWLFGMDPDRIDVVIHPESIIHSLVEFNDGSMMAQMGTPDMRTPIQYALTYPHRRACPAPRLDLCALGGLTLLPPDLERFPALRLGHEVSRRGGTAGAVLNAANEAAVELFRAGEIGYADIVRLVEETLQRHESVSQPTLEQLLRADRWARNEVTRCTHSC